mmetsp:Transcript_20371/g.64321  ORF Transcript_20371/g.64321 Transcript_20371/m.64321 type:complete len:492 (+) Transcript_20371:1-1476(+)
MGLVFVFPELPSAHRHRWPRARPVMAQLPSPLTSPNRQVPDSDLRIALYSSNFFTEDGVTLTCRRIIAYVKKVGGQVRILTTVPGERKPLDDRTVSDDEIIQIPAMDFPMPSYKRTEGESAGNERDGYVLGKMLGQRAMRELLKFGPNIMHVTAPDGGALAAISWAYRHNVPCMATWHSNFHHYVKFYPLPRITTPIIHFWLWFFYMQVPLVLVPTAPLRLELTKLGLNAKRMQVWGRGIDSSVFAPQKRSEDFRSRHGVHPDSVLLCWSSRIVIEKRFDIFAEVIRRMVADGLKVHALIAGKACDELGADQLKVVRSTLPNVSYIGWVTAEELAVVYASSDVLLFPSSVETFGNVTLEGMSSGMPCVVEAASGGHLVEDGVHGFTVRSGDVDGFYHATKKLCEPGAAGLRRRMGEAGRKRAVDQYGTVSNTKAMTTHYKMLIASSRRQVNKHSFRWFVIDIFANVVLAAFIIGSFIINKVVSLYLFLTGQ